MSRDLYCWVLLVTLLVGGAALPASAQVKCDFPSNQYVRERTVSLLLEGWQFTGGMSNDEHGKVNGDGTEVAPVAWGGSGFLIDADGTLLTNWHVAKRATAAVAVFDDGAQYPVKLIKGYNTVYDLATLQIASNRRFPAVQLADSNLSDVRDPVLAVGNTRLLGLNMAEGKITQIVRDDHRNPLVLRHDAAIAGGNSGGPLFRCNEVVGVNVRIIPGTQFGMAVPVNLASRLLEIKTAVTLENAFNYRSLPDTRQVFATNASVAASPSQENVGMQGWEINLGKLTDYAIVVESPSGANLNLVVTSSQGQLIGLGASGDPKLEQLFLSSEYPQQVVVWVVNTTPRAANFGIYVGEFVW